MSLNKYLVRKELTTVAKFYLRESDGEEGDFQLASSGDHSHPAGDPDYADLGGIGDAPRTGRNHPIWLVPMSGVAQEHAASAFQRQENGTDDTDDDALLLSSIEFGGETTPNSEQMFESVPVPMRLQDFQNGRWFQLEFESGGQDETTIKRHVWIQTDRPENFAPTVQVGLPWQRIGATPTPTPVICGFLVGIRNGRIEVCFAPTQFLKNPGEGLLAPESRAILRWFLRHQNGAWQIHDTSRISVKQTSLTSHLSIERGTDTSPSVLQYHRQHALDTSANSPFDALTNNAHIHLTQRIFPEDPVRPQKWHYEIDSQITGGNFPIWLFRLLNRSEVPNGMLAVRRGDRLTMLPELGGVPSEARALRTTYRSPTGSIDCTLSTDTDQALLLKGMVITDHRSEPIVWPVTALWKAVHVAEIESTDVERPLKMQGRIEWRDTFGGLDPEPDNGTLLEYFLDDLTLEDAVSDDDGGAGRNPFGTLYDGALALQLGQLPEGVRARPKPDSGRSRRDPHELGPNAMGRFRIVLQDPVSETPLYPWKFLPAPLANKQCQRTFLFGHAVEDFKIGIAAIDAAGTDRLPAEQLLAVNSLKGVIEGGGRRAEGSVVIPLPSKTSLGTGDSDEDDDEIKKSARYLLVANESVNAGQSLRLDFRLEQLPGDSSKRDQGVIDAVVLQPEPQLLARVRAEFLAADAGQLGTSTIARRSPLSENQNGWELLAMDGGVGGFTLNLAAQGIGEEVVKWTEKVDDPDADRYRFSRPAELSLQAERTERNFVSVPWNLTRIFGTARDAAAGAPLLRAVFELLYGLQATIKIDRNSGGLFITELAGKIGEMPTPPPPKLNWDGSEGQTNLFESIARQRNDLFNLWLRRVAILEPWRLFPQLGITLSDGVSYSARVGSGPIGADLAPPLIEKFLPTGHPHKNEGWDPDEYHSNSGLKGGFHYGFESRGIYEELIRNWHASSSGEISDLTFSNVGGWGQQTARFAGDKTVIQSTTSAGRTHVYAVERIGRIGIYWNRAKHVILYERSAGATAQFKEFQEGTGGRVLLRKVREYIEILEPVRNYPDNEDREAKYDSGFVRALVVPKGGEQINVSTLWARDVFLPPKKRPDPEPGEPRLPPLPPQQPIGYEVPLWKLGADPEVYPKPVIALQLGVAGLAGAEPVTTPIINPQQLYFYSDVRDEIDIDGTKVQITADTDAWPPIPEVDFPMQADAVIPSASPIFPGADSAEAEGTAAEMDAPLPGPTSVSPGMRRFTFDVVRSTPVAVAGTPDSPITGRIRNVTMMRNRGTRKLADQQIPNSSPNGGGFNLIFRYLRFYQNWGC